LNLSTLSENGNNFDSRFWRRFLRLRKNEGKGETVNVPVTDTTGAGDCFCGYFLAARERCFSIQDLLNIACKVATITVSKKGAMEPLQ
jgi:ribokinase